MYVVTLKKPIKFYPNLVKQSLDTHRYMGSNLFGSANKRFQIVPKSAQHIVCTLFANVSFSTEHVERKLYLKLYEIVTTKEHFQKSQIVHTTQQIHSIIRKSQLIPTRLTHPEFELFISALSSKCRKLVFFLQQQRQSSALNSIWDENHVLLVLKCYPSFHSPIVVSFLLLKYN